MIIQKNTMEIAPIDISLICQLWFCSAILSYPFISTPGLSTPDRPRQMWCAYSLGAVRSRKKSEPQDPDDELDDEVAFDCLMNMVADGSNWYWLLLYKHPGHPSHRTVIQVPFCWRYAFGHWVLSFEIWKSKIATLGWCVRYSQWVHTYLGSWITISEWFTNQESTWMYWINDNTIIFSPPKHVDTVPCVVVRLPVALNLISPKKFEILFLKSSATQAKSTPRFHSSQVINRDVDQTKISAKEVRNLQWWP